MKVALLQSSRGGHARDLGQSLRSAGAEATVLGVRPGRLPEAVLHARGFTGPLTQVPAAALRLLSGGFAVAHAFTPQDALSALWWRRVTGRPVVFTWTEPIRRENVADRRLKLALIERALIDTDAVTAVSEEIAEGARRWLAIEPIVLGPDDVAGHVQLYRAVASGLDHLASSP